MVAGKSEVVDPHPPPPPAPENSFRLLDLSDAAAMANNATSGLASEAADYESPVIAGVVAGAMLTVILATVAGNLLVILSVQRFERLRIVANSFIVSLAVADLLVAILVMPFNAAQYIAGRWLFGHIVCDIFNANDVLFSTASLLHLCCVSVDRYLAVTDPFGYDRKMSRRRAAAMLAVVWSASALLSHLPIHLGWYAAAVEEGAINTTDAERHDIVFSCANITTTSTSPTISSANNVSIRQTNLGVGYEELCLFEVNAVYGVVSSCVSFWTPAAVITFAYLKIFREARRQETRIRTLTSVCAASSLPSQPSTPAPAGPGGQPTGNGINEGSGTTSGMPGGAAGPGGGHSRGPSLGQNNGAATEGGGRRTNGKVSGASRRDSSWVFNGYWKARRRRFAIIGRPPSQVILDADNGGVGETSTSHSRTASSTLTAARPTQNSTCSLTGGASPSCYQPLAQQHRKKLQREHKAARTLGVVVGAFLFCWLPFFLWYLTTTLCGPVLCPTPDAIVTLLFWTGYANSALNPIIYACFNRDFRDAFRRILCCRRRRRHVWNNTSTIVGGTASGGGSGGGASRRTRGCCRCVTIPDDSQSGSIGMGSLLERTAGEVAELR